MNIYAIKDDIGRQKEKLLARGFNPQEVVFSRADAIELFDTLIESTLLQAGMRAVLGGQGLVSVLDLKVRIAPDSFPHFPMTVVSDMEQTFETMSKLGKEQ